MKSLFIRIFIVVSWITIFVPDDIACEGKVGVNVGECSPNFSIQSIDGKSYSLSQFKGKVVLLNFWATWCKPCIVEMPSMQKAYLQLKKSNIEILAVSIDTNEKEIKEFLDNQLQTHLKFPIFFDKGKAVSSQFGTFQVPETFIIDKSGRITDKVIGIREWDESITLNYLKLLSK